MNTRPAQVLRPCVIKGCSWRGLDPYACPFHDNSAWDRQWQLIPDDLITKSHTRHRA